MTQPLYTKQDNKELNEKLESFKMATVDIDMSDAPGRGMTSVQTFFPEAELQEQVKHARGMNPAIIHYDDAGFVEKPEPAPAVKIQNSSTFGTMNQKPSFTDGGIVVNTPNQPQFHLSPEMVKQAQAQLESGGGAVVLNADGSKQMFNNIKDMFAAKANQPVATPVTYFVDSNSKFHFGIDKTNMEPTPIVRLSGKNFEAKYLEQLESYIYNSQEELDPQKLFMFIYLVGFIQNGHFPIKVVTGRHRHQIKKIVKTLNTFFNKNHTVLTGIARMFNGMTVQPPEVPTKA